MHREGEGLFGALLALQGRMGNGFILPTGTTGQIFPVGNAPAFAHKKPESTISGFVLHSLNGMAICRRERYDIDINIRT